MISQVITYAGTNNTVKPVKVKINIARLSNAATASGSRIYKLKDKQVSGSKS